MSSSFIHPASGSPTGSKARKPLVCLPASPPGLSGTLPSPRPSRVVTETLRRWVARAPLPLRPPNITSPLQTERRSPSSTRPKSTWSPSGEPSTWPSSPGRLTCPNRTVKTRRHASPYNTLATSPPHHTAFVRLLCKAGLCSPDINAVSVEGEQFLLAAQG